MNVSVVRNRIAEAVQSGVTLEGFALQCFGYMPDHIDPPTFYCGEVDIDPNFTFGDDDKVILVCRVLTARSDNKAGQQALDQLLRRKGPTSIRRVLRELAGEPGEYALGGVADDLNVVKIQGYRLYTIGTEVFYGAEIRVLIIGDGEVD